VETEELQTPEDCVEVATEGHPWDIHLDTLLLPARVCSLIERRGLVTLRDALALDPATLVAEKNFGRGSLADLRAALEGACGTTWELARRECLAGSPMAQEAQEAQEAEEAQRAPRTAAEHWASLRQGLDDASAQIALDHVRDLPTRMRSFAAARGIETVGALLALPYESLLASKNVGRLTLRETRQALADACPAQEGAEPPVVRTLDDHPGLVELWRAETAALEAIPRLVVQQRSGLAEAAATLQTVGEMLGVSRERVRQIEVRAVESVARSPWWVEALTARLDGHLGAGAVSLSRLALDDPWFVSLHDQPDVFDFVNERFLHGRFHRVRLDDEACLALAPQGEFDRAWQRLDARLAGHPWPAGRAEVRAAVDAVGAPLGSAAVAWLEGRVEPLLTLADDDETVLAYGGTRAREILGWLRTQEGPVTVRALGERFGRGRWPEEVVFVERGVVTVVELLAGFEACRHRLVACCVAQMRAHGPDRQWSSAELAEALRHEEALPPWFGPWPLGAMLMRSEAVRYLGRGIVVLPEVEGERLHLRALVQDELTRAGGVLALAELERRVGARRGLGHFGLGMLLQKAPFLEVESGVYGLLARDLPGGPAAALRAATWLVEMLAVRGCGVSLREALLRLASHAAVYDAWTPSQLRSVCRQDPRLLTSIGGALGLAEWDDVRLPTRRALVRQALVEGQGRARVDALCASITAFYGEAPSRNSVAWTAWHEGASLEGDWIVMKGDAPTLDTTPEVLPGLHPVLQRRVAQLLEMVDEVDDLPAAVDDHVRRFYLDAVTSEGTDLQVVLKVQGLCHSILARVAHAPESLRRLGHAAVRYFLLNEDAAWDFVHQGLQDDLAVLEAAGRHLDAELSASAREV